MEQKVSKLNQRLSITKNVEERIFLRITRIFITCPPSTRQTFFPQMTGLVTPLNTEVIFSDLNIIFLNYTNEGEN